jgi:hypothetical protein
MWHRKPSDLSLFVAIAARFRYILLGCTASLESILSGYGKAGMEREDHKDRLEVAVRLYNELCAQYPKRFITLFDENGVRISAFNQPDAPAEQA